MNTSLTRARVVLIVEDDPLVRDFEAAALKLAGYEVLTAENGIEGGSVFARYFQEIDTLLTDISMPGMDGLKLAAFARNIRPDLHVIFASGSIDDACREGVGVVEGGIFLEKPFTAEDLIRTVAGLTHDSPEAVIPRCLAVS